MVDAIHFFYNVIEMNVGTIFKLKKVINSISVMHYSIILTSSFENIVNETCKILDCDRASVFLIDTKSINIKKIDLYIYYIIIIFYF